MPSQVALSSVFRLGLKHLCSTFSYLYLFEHTFLQARAVHEDDFYVTFVCLCYTLEGLFHKKTSKQKSKWSNYCLLSVVKCFLHILLERDDWKLLN